MSKFSALLLMFTLIIASLARANATDGYEFSPPSGFTEERSILQEGRSFVLKDLKGKTLARLTAAVFTENGQIIDPIGAPPSTAQMDRIFLLGRSSGLESLGFKKWSILSSKLARISGSDTFLYQVHGSYQDPSKNVMSFIEWHYLRGSKSYQFGWTQKATHLDETSIVYANRALAGFKMRDQ